MKEDGKMNKIRIRKLIKRVTEEAIEKQDRETESKSKSESEKLIEKQKIQQTNRQTE